jgi:hypothetical protein
MRAATLLISWRAMAGFGAAALFALALITCVVVAVTVFVSLTTSVVVLTRVVVTSILVLAHGQRVREFNLTHYSRRRDNLDILRDSRKTNQSTT